MVGAHLHELAFAAADQPEQLSRAVGSLAMPDTISRTEPGYRVTPRTRLRRRHERGSHARADVHAILDASPLCHVGYVIEGAPYVTPALQWREGDRVFWHGSAASRFLDQVEGRQVC